MFYLLDHLFLIERGKGTAAGRVHRTWRGDGWGVQETSRDVGTDSCS